MSQALTQLIQLLSLKPLGNGIFQGESQDLGLPQVFGGQVLAQSLAAAMAVVSEERWLHSCHAYFLRAGSAKLPIVYETELLHEGNSFTAASVTAKQEGETLLRVTASFHIDEQGFEHQVAVPEMEEPEQFYSEADLLAQMATMLPEHLRPLFNSERAFNVRLKYPNNPFQGQQLPAEQQLWVKTNGVLSHRRLQQCLLAYFSDFHCITTMLHPHECGVFEQKVRFATLEHSIRFHREFDFSQWLFFDIQSLNASGARGLASAQVFSQEGKLVATYSQEGLIRPI
ncbi:acyl-CoA thioesterase II [Bibersteinia trehalosi]|uniref:Acyl-CoA thioesterase 2 n=1 Tax=Bibersteinia trehalosi TaxID=47735 RepID=A0A3R8MI16_BIBTR|nr:acyl-CoA thioesterase II [Bibersteinia trehalosi]RRN04789.1 acyl-CoA thioesterase II [Bibersteinia trehalosi]